jgi:predicted nucleotidyltransferase
VLSTLEALRMARSLRLLLVREQIPLQGLYLFGSAARGTTHKWSDVDIAIVCNPFKKTPLEEHCTIASHAYSIDPRITILYFRPEHFASLVSGVVREVKREGILVEE